MRDDPVVSVSDEEGAVCRVVASLTGLEGVQKRTLDRCVDAEERQQGCWRMEWEVEDSRLGDSHLMISRRFESRRDSAADRGNNTSTPGSAAARISLQRLPWAPCRI
jgi:hypothetical protein